MDPLFPAKPDCNLCRGKGRVDCTECDSEGKVVTHITMSSMGRITCNVCGGTRRMPCFCTAISPEQWKELKS